MKKNNKINSKEISEERCSIKSNHKNKTFKTKPDISFGIKDCNNRKTYFY